MKSIYWYEIMINNSAWTLIASEQGMNCVLYPGQELKSIEGWLNRHAGNYKLIENHQIFEKFGVLFVLKRYFQGESISFQDIPTDLWGTPFQLAVWKQLKQISYGSLLSYKEIAEKINNPKAVRAVGAAVGANPLPILLPCHRVIGSDRTLTGYRGGLPLKSELLNLEGIRLGGIDNGKIIG